MGVETVIVEGEAVDEVSAMIERVKAQAFARKAPKPRRRQAKSEKRTKRKSVQKARRRNRR